METIALGAAYAPAGYAPRHTRAQCSLADYLAMPDEARERLLASAAERGPRHAEGPCGPVSPQLARHLATVLRCRAEVRWEAHLRQKYAGRTPDLFELLAPPPAGHLLAVSGKPVSGRRRAA